MMRLKRCVRLFPRRRDLIFDLVNAIDGVSAPRPNGAFYIFCDISSFGLNSDDFCAKLLEEKLVAAIPGGPFGADGWIRMSYACSDENICEACKASCRFLRFPVSRKHISNYSQGRFIRPFSISSVVF